MLNHRNGETLNRYDMDHTNSGAIRAKCANILWI